MKVDINPSKKSDKKYTAVFYDGDKKIKTIHFGLKNSTTYLDTGDKKLREAYRARHKKVYDKSPPMSASRLSYEIIWGDSTSLQKNIKDYKKKYGYI
tara:strand:- start:830 stop:1120 length:291 start_codon:yes stop_codon:yes gene_type:complete